MKFSFNLINKYLRPKVAFQTARKLLEDHLFETELIAQIRNDYILNIEILPNRAFDLFSHYGLARELASLFRIKKGKSIEFVEYKPKGLTPTPKPSINFIDESRNNLLRYSYLYIKKVKVVDSPDEIKNLLFWLGIKPINLLVDLTNLIMVEFGQPLHAFDADTLKNNTIKVAYPERLEKLEAFDGKVYDLDSSILTIRDANEPIAIAGVKGGLKTGINSLTRNVIIESANFSETAIRHTAASLKIGSDAEKRFKNGVDPKLTTLALAKFLELYFKYSAKSSFEFYDFKNSSLINRKRKPISISLLSINSLLNTNFGISKIKQTLKTLYFEIVKTDKRNLTVAAPIFRNDIQIEEDVIDEIFRLMDLQNIKRTPYYTELKKPVDLAGFKIISRIRSLLLNNGFSEIVSYSAVSKRSLLDFYNESQFANLLRIKNPISLEFEYLRPNLLITLLQAVFKNIRFYDRFKLFEVGKIYRKNSNDQNQLSYEENCLGLAVYSKSNDLYEQINMICALKGLVAAIFEPWGEPQFVYNKNGELTVFIRSFTCGSISYLSPHISRKYRLQGKVLMAELFLDKIIRLKPREQRFYPFSKHPAVKRDLSLILGSLRYDEVIKMLNNLNLKYLRDIQLFDIYVDKDKGFTSYTLHLYFGIADRNITEQEADGEFQVITNALKAKGIKIR